MSSTALSERPRAGTRAAARTVDATKVYGKGTTEVRALDGVTVEFAAGGSPRSWARRARASRRCCTAWPASTRSPRARPSSATPDLSHAGRPRAHRPAARPDRLRLPGVQPDPDAHAPREHRRCRCGWPAARATRRGSTRSSRTLGIARPARTTGPTELSGGQQQRVAVARALASRPEIIFADEPTGNLDSKAGAEVLRFLRQAVDELGQTIVMVTHDPIAASYADRIVFLADGRVVDEMHEPDGRAGARADEAVRGVTGHALDHASRACSPTGSGCSPRRWPSPSASRSRPARWCSPTPSASTFDNLFGERLPGHRRRRPRRGAVRGPP